MNMSDLITRVKGFDYKSFKKSKYVVPLIIVLSFVLLILFSPLTGYRIITRSMEPTIKVNDVVIVNRWVNKSTIEEGDIIAFRTFLFNANEKEIIVHYVHSVTTNEDGKRVFKTIAEGQDLPDRWEIEDEDVIGIYLFKIQGVGRIIEFFQSPFGLIVLIVDVGLIYFFSNISDDLTKKNKKKKPAVKFPPTQNLKVTQSKPRKKSKKTQLRKPSNRVKKPIKNEKESSS